MTAAPSHHFRRPAEPAFTLEERERVTVLVGGLTTGHDRLVAAALEGLGHRAAALPTPTKADFQTGKEYGNNGQCNPTYFNVGALINHLKRLRDEANVPTESILSDYVFATAGSCGPCRFGMYEAEYRLALRNAGFDGFRVLIFNQEGGFPQSNAEAGLQMNLTFFATLANAIFIGDLLNEVAYHIRPYELRKGITDRVLEECLRICCAALRSGADGTGRAGLLHKLLARVTGLGAPQDFAKLFEEWRGQRYLEALQCCRELIDAEIEVDYTRAKPIAKITGEFWAQTTEGDGNFHMFRFLEHEGAEALVEPVTTWIHYSVHYARLAMADRRALGKEEIQPGAWQGLVLRARHLRDMSLVALVEKLLVRAYESRRRALGATAHRLANQFELQRVGHPYYNSRCGGGEGHLEVAKNIYYGNRDLAHLVLSLKPFGCMPSTQSDGAQAAVLAHYPEMIFLPVETSGEGDINAYSRVQMALGEAKSRSKEEFRAAVVRSGYTLGQIRAFVAAHHDLRRPLCPVAHTLGFVGRAANFVLHVSRRMDRDPTWAPCGHAVKGGRHELPAERPAEV